MKDFMVLLVILPLLLVFTMQFSVDQLNKAKVELLDEIVYEAKEQAKQDGCFTEKNQTQMVTQICARLHVDASAVSIETDGIPRNRKSIGARDDGLIHYSVRVDLGEAMAGSRLFGIPDEENTFVYSMDSYTVSEYLP